MDRWMDTFNLIFAHPYTHRQQQQQQNLQIIFVYGASSDESKKNMKFC